MSYKRYCCTESACSHFSITSSTAPAPKKKKNKTVEDWQVDVDRVQPGRYKVISVSREGFVTYLELVCAVHGTFKTRGSVIKKGGNCPKCAKGSVAETYLENFLVKASGKQLARYLPLSVSSGKRGSPAKITSVCSKHGVFTQALHHHLSGIGCANCGFENTGERCVYDLTQWKHAVAKTHGDKYKVLELLDTKPPQLKMFCDLHGEFNKVASAAAYGEGCRDCGRLAVSEAISHNEEDVLKRVVDFDKTNTVLSVYRGRDSSDYLRWYYSGLCPKHGEVKGMVKSYLSGKNYFCPDCGRDNVSESRKLPWTEVLRRCVSTYGDLYSYVGYVGEAKASSKILAVCQKHGQFAAGLYDHVAGSGCPSCGTRVSKGQREVADLLSSEGLVVELEKRFEDSRMAFDICVESKKLLIEYNGLHWHSERTGKMRQSHRMKSSFGESKGYRVIQIMEDEWLSRKAQTLALLLSACGIRKQEKLSARSCSVSAVSASDARAFLQENHIQGYSPATAYFALSHSGVIVALASFTMKSRGRAGRRSSYESELVRFATSKTVRGGLSRLVEHARRTLGFTVCTTFSDSRLFSGASYGMSGFLKVAETPPDYTYVNTSLGMVRYKKRNYQLTNLKTSVELSYEEGQTEVQAMAANGYFRLWDCGKVVWQRRWL